MWRVLQVHTDAGWEHGVAGSLRREPDLEVHSVTYTNETSFLRDVTRIQPDVILLNEDGPLSLAQLHQLLARVPAQPSLRIIVVTLRSNVIDIYDSQERQQVVITRLDDLSDYIRGEHRV